MRSLASLQDECARLGITVETTGRQNKEAWISALRNHHWEQEYPAMPLPPQVQPMLLDDWQRLDHQAVEELESDHCDLPKSSNRLSYETWLSRNFRPLWTCTVSRPWPHQRVKKGSFSDASRNTYEVDDTNGRIGAV